MWLGRFKAFKFLSARTIVSFFIALTIIIAVTKYAAIPRLKHGDDVTEPVKLVTTEHTGKQARKNILFWNDFFGMPHFGRPLGEATFRECRVSNCALWDRLDEQEDLPVEEFDALVFHGIDTGLSSVRDLPRTRAAHQRYIFLLHESPAMRPEFYNLDNFFNWTATYRRSSDFYMPYVRLKDKFLPPPLNGWREPTFDNLTDDFADIVANKSRHAVWFVSNPNTHSKRDKYVRLLSQQIPVDEFGPRGQFQCSSRDDTCDTLLDTTYKFYLAFENSLCEDYITEKFSRALSHYIIPVVYGGGDYSAVAPPLSYINVKDFSSPRHLAEYLYYLDRNPGEYVKYFWWRKFYSFGWNDWYCDLCEKLNDSNEPMKMYPSINSWWNYKGVCPDPVDVLTTKVVKHAVII